MIVIVLTACPPGLRGQLTRWLLEISPGVFVGHVSARVREQVWRRVTELSGPGRALLVYSARGEQRLAFEVHNHDWVPVDHDGLALMLRPGGRGVAGPRRVEAPSPDVRLPRDGVADGWSTAARRRRFGREMEQVRRREWGPGRSNDLED